MTQCLIALGGNINASQAVFLEAMRRLERPEIVVKQLSRPFVTRPVGSAAGQEYVNAAAVLECSLESVTLLNTLHEVEDSFGRERTVHWGPRTLGTLKGVNRRVVGGPPSAPPPFPPLPLPLPLPLLEELSFFPLDNAWAVRLATFPAIRPAANCDIALRRVRFFFFVIVFSLIRSDLAQMLSSASANEVTLKS